MKKYGGESGPAYSDESAQQNYLDQANRIYALILKRMEVNGTSFETEIQHFRNSQIQPGLLNLAVRRNQGLELTAADVIYESRHAGGISGGPDPYFKMYNQVLID